MAENGGTSASTALAVNFGLGFPVQISNSVLKDGVIWVIANKNQYHSETNAIVGKIEQIVRKL
ncbi:MAG TPA: hypothetical protein VLH61_04465 [Bacteroidales bacterium]|nr:hypothetical protein [Bacteroidales bacterium]